MNNSELILYESTDGQTKIDVRLENETVWLTLNQISVLFERDKSVISRHLKNIFDSDELDRNSVVAKNATTATDGKTYQVEYFNLDAILSIGYRVNSKRGTQFRQWATNRLKEYLIKGYALNEKRLQENLEELETTIKAIKQLGKGEDLKLSEAKGLLELISNYANSFILLNRFDRQDLDTEGLNPNITYDIEYHEAVSAVNELKRLLIAKNEARNFSAIKKTRVLPELWEVSSRLSEENIFIRASKSKPLICFISLSKIILLQMEINELAHFCLSGFWRKTSIVLTGKANLKLAKML